MCMKAQTGSIFRDMTPQFSVPLSKGIRKKTNLNKTFKKKKKQRQFLVSTLLANLDHNLCVICKNIQAVIYLFVFYDRLSDIVFFRLVPNISLKKGKFGFILKDKNVE